ncbi:uncharacterized protein [Miscanthus floridulus]|uniref:uncharacterized protein n=1 Tax=Miscanthus floridulus TaxID=154761 RepID=UPI0034590B8B
MSITTWRQTKVEVEARDEAGDDGDDVEAGDEGKVGNMKALPGDKESDGASARTREEDEGAVRAGAEDKGEASRSPEDEDKGTTALIGEEEASHARTGAEDENASRPTEDKDVGATTRAGAEDMDEDPSREPEKRARSDGRRTVGVVARRSAWRGSYDA